MCKDAVEVVEVVEAVEGYVAHLSRSLISMGVHQNLRQQLIIILSFVLLKELRTLINPHKLMEIIKKLLRPIIVIPF